MDTGKLIELLKGTIDPVHREEAEKQLDQAHKIIGFCSSLLQVVMMSNLDIPVRQAGVIYLKNLVAQHWAEKEQEAGKLMVFTLHEQDRATIRDAIVDAVVHAPELLRIQLAVCVNHIVKHDFPHHWTGIVDKILIYLQSPDTSGWMGSLLCLHQLVKNFEYKKPEERVPLNEAMNLLLPMMYQRIVQLLPDQSETSVLLQKQILKIFPALVQYFLPLELISKESFAQWMEVFRAIVDQPVPEATNQIDDDEKPDLPWWKCKKWAMHILFRVFERYGSPETVAKDYREFADYYLKAFSGGIIEVLLKVLDQYRNKIYMSPRVLQLALNYLNQAVTHAFSWKFLKPHMMGIIQDIIFQLMCYTDEDDELWKADPQEYIRMKFDVFEDFISPVIAAQTLFHSAVKKRKDMLQKAMGFVLSILTNPTSSPRQKDGAMHMVGTVADILLKKKFYKDQMENMLVMYVFPEFSSPHGYMRARACWVLHYFSEIKFKNETNLIQALNMTQNCLLNDQELPVKVEAAIGLQTLITSQDKAQNIIRPNIKPITLELLKVIRETESDNLTNVMQKIVCIFSEELLPIALEMTQHLAQTFTQVIENGTEDSDERAITAMGVLNTIDTILSVMEDQKEVTKQLEPVVLHVIGVILSQGVLEFYEEAMSLVYSLTCNYISSDMWKVFEMIYHTFQKNGFDYFTDMMPALHNFVTVDTPAFISNHNHLLVIYDMCKTVLTGDACEDAECHAAKLLEVVILQCKGQIDQCIPSFVELAVNRLLREVKTSELRTMCLQVVISALYYNPSLLIETLEKIQVPNTTSSVTAHFIQQWLHDTQYFMGLHDRKLCVLGLCTLMNTSSLRPPIVNQCANQIIPSLLQLFEGLKKAYAYRAQEEDDSDSDSDDEDDYDPEALESDEDEIDDEGTDYLERLARKAKAKSPFNITSSTIEDDDDDDDEEGEETALESYTTPIDDEDNFIDEYVIFKDVILNVVLSVSPKLYLWSAAVIIQRSDDSESMVSQCQHSSRLL
ncbi:importin-7 msk isoform X2 [Tachypleus tridentatus]|uniref:importin-7 msk isoform X2 n=1 Tax=Tachypleus tridentatus TaxID=6853 RepID=UPI003FD61B0E